MQNTIQNIFNFVHDNLGKDDTIIGLCGLKKETEFSFVQIPNDLKHTFIQKIDKNYLLL